MPIIKEDSPKFKLKCHGAKVMTTTELLAVLIRNGIQDKTNVDLAKEIVGDEELYELATIRDIKELTKINGIGEEKACSILAAIELGKRVAYAKRKEEQTISSPEDFANLFVPTLRHLTCEYAFVAILNAKNQLIKTEKISQGSLSFTVVHPREVFYPAVLHHAAGIIFAHNHPSGDPTPSKEDKSLTETLKVAGQTMMIPLLDHIIIGDGTYFSFKEHGYL